MRIPRFYQSGKYDCNNVLQLNEEVFAHAIKVLRLKKDDRIILFNGHGKKVLAKIETISKKNCEVTILQELSSHPPSPCVIHLYQSIIKNDPMDWCIQKTVELGVNTITPFISAYTDQKINSKQLEKKLKHWEKIIINACEQCGRDDLPKLNPPLKFAEIFTSTTDPILLFDPSATTSINKIKQQPKKISLIIGAEGGFTQTELEYAKNYKSMILSLGPRILRAETAALSAMTLIQHYWGDLYF